MTERAVTGRERRRRALRWWFGLVVMAVLVALCGLLWVTQTYTGRQWLARTALRVVNEQIPGRVALRELSRCDLLPWSHTLGLRGLEVYDPTGERVAGLERLELRWRPSALLSGAVRVQWLRGFGLELDLQHLQEPGRGIVNAFVAESTQAEESPSELNWDVYLQQLELNARRVNLPAIGQLKMTEVRDLALAGGLSIEQGDILARVERAGLRWQRAGGSTLLQLDALKLNWPRPEERFGLELALTSAGASARVDASGRVPRDVNGGLDRLDVRVQVEGVQLNSALAHWGVEASVPQLRGPWQVLLEASGSLSDARGSVKLQTPGGALELPWELSGQRLKWQLQSPSFQLDALLVAGDLPRPLRFAVDWDGELELPSDEARALPLSVRASTHLNGQALPRLQASAVFHDGDIRDLQLDLDDDFSQLSLRGQLPQRGERYAELSFQLDAQSVKRVQTALGQPAAVASGRIEGTLALRDAQRLSVVGNISGTRFRAGAVALAALRADLDLAFETTQQRLPWPSGRATVRVHQLTLPGAGPATVIPMLRISARGSERRYRVQGELEAGELGAANVTLSLERQSAGALVVVGDGSGRLFTEPWRFRLRRTTIDAGARGIALQTDGLELDWLTQRLLIAGKYRDEALDVRVQAQRLALDRLQALVAAWAPPEPDLKVAGSASLDIHVAGKAAQPQIEGNLELRQVTLRWPNEDEKPPLNLAAQVMLSAVEGQARTRVTLDSSLAQPGKRAAPERAAAQVELALESRFRPGTAWVRELARGTQRVQLKLARLDSAWLERWLKEPLPARGDLRGELSGEWADPPRFEGRFLARVYADPGRPPVRVRPRLRYDGSEAELHLEADDAQGALLRVNANVSLPLTREGATKLETQWPNLLRQGYRVRLSIPARDLRDVPFVARSLEPPVPSLMLQLHGEIEQQLGAEPNLDVRLSAQQLESGPSAPGCRPGKLGALLHVSGARGLLRADLAAAQGSQPLAHVNLQTPLSLPRLLEGGDAMDVERQRLKARARQLALSSLPIVCRYAQGVLNLDVDVEAPLGAAPRADARLQVNGFTLEQAEMHLDARLHADASEVRLQAHATDTTNPQHRSQADAHVPWEWSRGKITLAPTAPLSVAIALRHLPLAPLIPHGTGLSHVAGTLNGKVELGGSWLLPELSGELELHDAALTYTDIAQPLHDIHARLALFGQDVRIERLVAKDGAGVLEVRGGFRLEQGRSVLGNARVELDEFPLRQNGQVAASVTGKLGVDVEHRALATLVRLRIEELDTYLESYRQRGGLALTPHPDITVDGVAAAPPSKRAEPGAPKAAEEATATARAQPNGEGVKRRASEDDEARALPQPPPEAEPARRTRIEIESSERFWVKRDDFALRLLANLQVELVADGPRVTGEVSVDRGYIDLLGKVFDVDKAGGQLRFTGLAAPDPLVHLSANHENRRTGDVVTVLIGGRASAPDIAFQVNGRTAEAGAAVAAIYGSARTTDSEASAKSQAASILAGVTAGLLATTARRELGSLAPILMIEAGDAEQAARVRAGFEFDSLVPKALRDIITGVYFEGIVATESRRGADRSSTQRTGAGALLELYFPYHLFTSGQYGPGQTWSVDLGWQL